MLLCGDSAEWPGEMVGEWPVTAVHTGHTVVSMTKSDTREDAPRLAEHHQRLDWMTLAPDVFKVMTRLDTATGQGVDANVLHLVKIRSSQVNRCAFCIDMHTKDALVAGESVDRIVQLDGWRESKHFYTAKEIAAIELTEAITQLTRSGVPDDVYARAAEEFTETELAYLIGAIAMINAWNRFGVSTRMIPGHYTPGS
jgi:AhpD family alkylhydroperoxidase